MDLKQFEKYCEKFDDNITDIIPENRFNVVCKKCETGDVHIFYNGKQLSQGSEYTGVWTSQEFNLVFKCINCGNAISIIDGYDGIESEEETNSTE